MFQKISTRTIGVLTKLDIMDEGTNAKKILLNEVIPLKLGYVGVKNRSKEDRINKISKAETIRKEKEFFKSHQFIIIYHRDFLELMHLLIN